MLRSPPCPKGEVGRLEARGRHHVAALSFETGARKGVHPPQDEGGAVTYIPADASLICRTAASTLSAISVRPSSAAARRASPSAPVGSRGNGNDARRERSTPRGCTAIS